MPEIIFISIGQKAAQIIASTTSATVQSKTSKGIFLSTSTGWLVFLSFERYRGPLTINLSVRAKNADLFPLDEEILCNSEGMVFPQMGIDIGLSGVPIWNPPPPQSDLQNMGFREADVKELIESYNRDNTHLLRAVLGPPAHDNVTGRSITNLQHAIASLTQPLKHGQWALVTSVIKPVIGMGEGLTPAGDDFVIGMFTSLSRWFPDQKTEYKEQLFAPVIDYAYQKTTTLSANLIECAAEGQADERIITACDALMTGSADPGQAVNALLTWGSTSGAAALAGIAAASVNLYS